MPREDFALKARRYLAEGRLTVLAIDATSVRATCRGDGGEIYDVVADPGGWACTCPARSRCAHMQALMLVALRPLGVALDRERSELADQIAREAVLKGLR